VGSSSSCSLKGARPGWMTPAVPVAAGYSGSVKENTAFVVAAATGLLTNDSGTGITVTSHTSSSHGTVTVNADGSYTYTPATGYVGPDSFGYTITDTYGQSATERRAVLRGPRGAQLRGQQLRDGYLDRDRHC